MTGIKSKMGRKSNPNHRKGYPSITNANNATIRYNIAFPKSGCKYIKKKMGKIKRNDKRNDFTDSFCLSARNEAKVKDKNGLRTSEKCSCKPKILIHRTAPLLSIPIAKVIKRK